MQKKFTEIKIPFTPITLCANELLVLASRPSVGKTLFAINIIEGNSLLNGNKVLAFFVGSNKKRIENHSTYSKLIESENVKLNFVPFGRGDQFIFDIKREINENKPQYIIIDGLEQMFRLYEKDMKLLPEIDLLLSDLRLLCDEKKIPIIITTHLLLSAEYNMSPTKTYLSHLGSNTLEIVANYILCLSSLFYYGYQLGADEKDISKQMELHQLKPSIPTLSSYQFKIDREACRFSPINDTE